MGGGRASASANVSASLSLLPPETIACPVAPRGLPSQRMSPGSNQRLLRAIPLVIIAGKVLVVVLVVAVAVGAAPASGTLAREEGEGVGVAALGSGT